MQARPTWAGPLNGSREIDGAAVMITALTRPGTFASGVPLTGKPLRVQTQRTFKLKRALVASSRELRREFEGNIGNEVGS